VSKENHKKIARKKFAKDVNIATYFVLSIALSEESFIKRINKDPTRGKKLLLIILENSFKLKLNRLII